MRPGEAVERALTGRSPRTAHGVTPRSLGELERAYGGPKGAAAAAGVSRETWRRWRLGTQKPKASSVTAMEAAVRRARLAAGRRRRLLSGKPLIRLAGDYRVSNDMRHRELDDEALAPSQGQFEDLITAYERGDDAAMEAGLNAIVGNYVPGMVIEDVTGIWLGAGTWGGDEEW